MNQIQAWDYVVLSLILFISISIGLYHGFKEKLKNIWFIVRRKNKINDETPVESETNNNGKTTDYLIATSSMRTIPVAFSLLATYYSATSLLGFPAEIYQYGIQYWLAVFAQSLSPIIGAFVTLPFLANFNIISVFEYFELRFDRSKYVRLVAVACYFIRNLISCAIFMYGPATSLALLVNFDEKICIAMIGVIATFYTTIGGIRGVIWNDLFQALIMFTTLILIVIKGIIDVGGFSNMLEINRAGGRLDLFDFNPDPFIRQSFWSLTFGQVFLNLMSYCFDQQSLQRFRATKTRKKAQRALVINSPAAFILVSLCCTAGLCLYANFVGCDPITNPNPNEKIQNPNQLMGYFVLNNLGSYPGVGGLFLGAIFCASLSSVSSVLSSQASIVWQDFLKLFEYFRSFDDSKSLLTNKIVVILCGLLCTGLAFLVSTIGGNLAQISAGLNGAFNAPLVGLFLLSMFFSVTTPIGAIVGTIVGFFCSAWVAFGAIIVKPIYPALNVSIELCDLNGNFNTDYYSNRAVAANELTGFNKFYALSYTWYATFGILATLISGLIASLLSGGLKKSPQAKEYVYFDFCCCLFGCSKRSNQQTDE